VWTAIVSTGIVLRDNDRLSRSPGFQMGTFTISRR